jgi:hypothetical protein
MLLLQVSFVHRVIDTMGDDVPERKQLEELMTSCSLPPQTVIQTLCSASQSGNGLPGSVHASPNTTPHATPPGTPNTSRRQARLMPQRKLLSS